MPGTQRGAASSERLPKEYCGALLPPARLRVPVWKKRLSMSCGPGFICVVEPVAPSAFLCSSACLWLAASRSCRILSSSSCLGVGSGLGLGIGFGSGLGLG